MKLKTEQRETLSEAQVFRRLRISAGLSTRQLAQFLGCTSSFVTHYETMRDPLPKARIVQLCRIFSITPEQLEGFQQGINLPISYRDECKAILLKMDEEKLKAVYGILTKMIL